MPTTKRLVALAGSNRSTLLSVTSSPCSDWRIGSIMRRASGVGVMAWPWRMNSGSSNISRMRPSAWLIAGCERLSRRLARVMPPSA